MLNQTDNFKVIQEYFSNLVAQSHADGNPVVRINYPVIGLIVLTHNDEKPLEINEGYKDYSKILWFYKNEDRYSLAYNKKTTELEIRKNSIHGTALAFLSNLTPMTDMIAIFEKL